MVNYRFRDLILKVASGRIDDPQSNMDVIRFFVENGVNIFRRRHDCDSDEAEAVAGYFAALRTLVTDIETATQQRMKASMDFKAELEAGTLVVVGPEE